MGPGGADGGGEGDDDDPETGFELVAAGAEELADAAAGAGASGGVAEFAGGDDAEAREAIGGGRGIGRMVGGMFAVARRRSLCNGEAKEGACVGASVFADVLEL